MSTKKDEYASTFAYYTHLHDAHVWERKNYYNNQLVQMGMAEPLHPQDNFTFPPNALGIVTGETKQ